MMKFARLPLVLITTSLLFVPNDLNGENQSPLLEVRYVESGPTIDGDPTDPVWESANSVDTFTRVGDSKFASTITTVSALYDDQSLYILFTCRGKPTGEVRASAIRRESPIWETDDDVELFFMPGDQDTLYIQLAANAIGTEYDIQSSNRDYYKDFAWTTGPGWSDDRWFMEMEIPLHPFAGGVKSGEVWRANFARHFWSGPDSVIALSWSPMKKTLHERENFGRIRFDTDVAFRSKSMTLDLDTEESRSIDHIRRLKGEAVYQPILEYLDATLTHRVLNRSFEHLQSVLFEFIRNFPDSSASFDMALRSIHPTATSYRVSPEVVESMVREYESILDLDRAERDLLELDRALFYNEIHRQDQWLDSYRDLATKDPRVAATAAYLLLSRSKFESPVSQENLALIRDALSTYTDLVIKGSTPIYMPKGVNWLSAFATRDDVYNKYYNVMKWLRKIVPEEIRSFCRTLSAEGDHPDEVELVLRKIEFEQYYDRTDPNYDPQKADSLIVIVNEMDKEYAQIRLNTLLREKILQLDQVYLEMGPDSIPAAVKKATELRKHFDGFHPIDMVFALCYETADSLDKAVDYLENYRRSLEGHWQGSGPIARYLDEVKFRRDNRANPDFFTVPENDFRVVYKLQGYRQPSNILEISGDGRAILHSNVPDSLDPRSVIDFTLPAVVDSPAVTFRIDGEEVDSIRTLLVRSGFLGFKLKNTEKCYRCGNREITLFTPWNMRTIHLEGENPARAPFQLESSVAMILNRYMLPLFYLQTDWKELTNYYSKWDDYYSPSRSPERRLDDLIDLFHLEPVPSSWQNEEVYIGPLLSLAEATGRTEEVEAAIGVRYFESIFKWKGYAKERLPEPDSKEIVKSRDYLQRAEADSDDEKSREWFGFLSAFSRDYPGDLDMLSGMTESLKYPENRGNARSLLIWLACARGEFDLARSLHAALVDSKAPKETKFDATIRMMLFSKDNNRYEEALDYLRQIERNYARFLRERRQLPIQEIDDYSKPDYLIDIAYLTFVSGVFAEAENRIQSIDETAIPPDRKNDYEEVVLLDRYREIPSTFTPFELPDYLRVFSALNRAGLHDHTTRWGIWLMDNVDDAKTRSQITSLLTGIFTKREVWDDLQVAMAGKLLEDYRADPGWKSVELTPRILDTVIEHGDEEDVKAFWRDEIQPYPVQTTRITPLDRLAAYFTETNDLPELQQVLVKIRNELTMVENDSPIAKLVKLKYSLDLADLYATHLNQPEKGIALVDSLVGRLPEFGSEAYPYAFGAIADWKVKQMGWDALVRFVQPMADSLIRAEKEVEWNVYHPHLIPDRPMDSPLLALRCLVQQGGLRRLDTNFLDLLDLDSDNADPVIKDLKISPSRLNLDCDQASLLNWRDESFEAILTIYNRQIR